ncbi:MAG TPA: flagellar hook-length control protein FliK [Clostridia bacterium]|nr:flagellar hook-length control protein FliK [Clostridia bacterium]
MVNAIVNVHQELPTPVQAAQTASSLPSTGFSIVKDGVFTALGIKTEDVRASETGTVDMGIMNMLSMLAAATQITISEETQQIQVSDPAVGIASILEGFGLLNAEGNLTIEASELLKAAYAAAESANVQPEAEQAGMPKVQPDVTEVQHNTTVEAESLFVPAQDEAGRTEILSELAPLVNEYLKSLENAHSQTTAQNVLVEDTSTEGTAQTAPMEATPFKAISEAFLSLIAAVNNALSEKNAAMQAPVVLSQAGEPVKLMQSTEETLPQGTFTLGDIGATKGFEPLPDVAPTAQAVPTDTAKTVMDLVDNVSIQAKSGATEFEVTLKPEHLGNLSIKLTQDADGLKAQIKAADPTVKSLLENELSSLQTMLKEKGVEVHKIDITYEANALAFDIRQGQRQSGSAQESKHRTQVLSVSRAGAYSVAEAPRAAPGVMDEARLALQGSSVEFSA